MSATKQQVVVKQRLVEARAKVAVGWTKGLCAATARGLAVPTSDPLAVKFCALGAVLSVCWTKGKPIDHDKCDPLIDALTDALRRRGRGLGASGKSVIASWNDEEGTSQEDVLGLFDEVIAPL